MNVAFARAVKPSESWERERESSAKAKQVVATANSGYGMRSATKEHWAPFAPNWDACLSAHTQAG